MNRAGLRLMADVLALARFRASGFAQLRGGVPDVLASLAPLLALPLATGLLLLLAGAGRALAAPLAAIAVVLGPLVISDALAGLWQRRAAWGRFAAAYNWCQWPLAVAACAAMLADHALVVLGMDARLAALFCLLAISAYQLGLHWFLAWRGLGVSALRAALLTLIADGFAVLLLSLFMLLYANPDQVANGSVG